jgi:leucyl-tRNA synthetase
VQRYNPKEIEPKWQAKWAETKIYEADDDSEKPKRYILEYFPYPSGAAMHVGHVRNYTIGDALTRHARMNGQNVLHPMGWDAFGLPAENYAIKTGISPQEAIKQNTGRFKQQLTQMGFGYDWSREITSSDPEYYKWTQWFFLLLYKRGLAYQKESPQWWCPVDKTVLANEQVENGRCWRCGSEVEKKALNQWFFKITDYADRLEKDLDDVDWSESIKTMQRNWIGHKTGINIDYKVENVDGDEHIVCFTTRPDTNFGATFVVLAPEHPFVQKVMSQEIVPNDGQSHWQAVEHYVQKAMSKSELERKEEGRLKTGAFTGFHVVNPLNSRKLPIWVSDFVLSGFGTGAVVGVPGHDMRDFEFAKEFGLPVERVVIGADGDDSPITKPEQVQESTGKMINSGPLDGLDIHDAIEKMKDLMEEKSMGERTHSYSIRDWLISRQRYWGAPIPMIHCEKDGTVPVPEDQLPVVLPKMESYEPSGDGRSPLARVPEFVNTTCPKCGGKAERETDTMDGFACSSWYFLRFADPHNNEKPFSDEKVKYWLPVDDYIGGAEHAVMHLLYARMWTKVMFDEGLIEFNEPFKKLRNHGMILAPDGRKMSKSWGNVIAPDELIEQGYGADAIRIMELFVGPWNQTANWSVEGMGGSFRFLQRVWALVQGFKEQAGKQPDEQSREQELNRIAHKTIKKVSQDLESLSFNTAVAAMMEAVNDLYKVKEQDHFANADAWRFALESLLQLLAPFAPHMTEELWRQLDHEDSIHTSEWPKYDEKYLVSETVTVVVQVNGKVRAQIEMPTDADETAVTDAAKANEKVQAHIAGKEIVKTIFVPGKILNIVVR